MKKWTDLFSIEELIIYEDDKIVVINKPPGVATQDDQSHDLSLLKVLNRVKKTNLHLLNRIDRPVSGIVVALKKGFKPTDFRNIFKKYLAIVHSSIPVEGVLNNYIKRDGRRRKGYISETPKPSYKSCQLNYKVVHNLDRYSVIEIMTDTGRFHQIRAQFGHIGFPIRGDVKYGARRSNKDRSIDLHAYQVSLTKNEKVLIAKPIGRERIWQEIESMGFFHSESTE